MRRRALMLLVVFIFFHSLLFLTQVLMKPAGVDRVTVLNDGWYVRYNETEYQNVKLSELRRLIGSGTYRGDKITLVNDNVDLSDMSDSTLMLETRFSVFRVCVDEIDVERKYISYLERGRFIGCENNYIPLPEKDRIVKLTIELTVAEDGAYGYYEAPVVGDYADIFIYTVYHHMFVFTISAFLIIFGLMFFVIGLGFGNNFPEIRMLMFSALLFIDLGVWFLTQFKLFDLFMETGGRQTEVEYISLYLLVPIMYLVIGSMQSYLKRKSFVFFAGIGALVPAALIYLHYAGIAHINRYLWVYQLNALVLVIFMLTMLYQDRKNKRIKDSQRIQILGQLMLTISFVINVIFYYLEVAGVMDQIMFSKKIVPIGAICMVFSTLVNYSIYISASYARKQEYQSLAHYAYADGLTGIPNRARFEKAVADLEKKESDYCVVSIDLNGLKTVNDNQGHLMGDKYLREFASVLEEAVEEKGLIARIGGDEFVAILKGAYMNLADEVIKEIEAALDKLNMADPVIHRSAAFGCAFRHEADSRDWNDTYLLADERMYKNKAEIKSRSH